jgi:tyrosine-protein kinase
VNLKEFSAAVARYRWTAVVAAAAVLVFGLAVLLLLPAKYVSNTQLLVTIEGATTADAYQNDEVVAGRVNSYVGLLTSGAVVQRVIDSLHLPLDASTLAAKISATEVPPRTSLIDVAVTDDSPERAQQIATTLTREFISYTDALETPTGQDGQKVHTRVVTEASQPHARTAERLMLGALIVLAALLAAAVAVWVRSRTDPILRSPDQAETAAGAPVLANLMTDGDRASELNEYRRLRTRLGSIAAPARDDGRGRVLVLASAADELDTPLVASNLGRAMQLSGGHSIVLDACPTRSLADETDTERPPGRHADLPETRPMRAWVDEPNQLATRVAAELIDELRGKYDNVLIATPPVLSTVTASTVAEYADAVVLLVSPGTTARRGVARAAADLRATGAPLIGTIVCRAGNPYQAPLRPDAGSTVEESNSEVLRRFASSQRRGSMTWT